MYFLQAVLNWQMWSHDDFIFFTAIGGKSINITIKIADGKYNESSLSDGFDKEVTTFVSFYFYIG